MIFRRRCNTASRTDQTLLTGSRKERVSRALSRHRGHLEITGPANILITTHTSGQVSATPSNPMLALACALLKLSAHALRPNDLTRDSARVSFGPFLTMSPLAQSGHHGGLS